MLDRACVAKVVIYRHVSKTKVKPFQYGRTHYEVRIKSVVNRFPAHRVHHSETIIAVVAFSLRSLSKDRHTKTNLTFYRDDVAVAMTTQIIEHSNSIPRITCWPDTVSDNAYVRLGLGTRLPASPEPIRFEVCGNCIPLL